MTRLLIIEDDGALGALLEECLNPNYEIVVLNRGDDAIQKLKEEKFDLILTDIILPGADGLTILKQVCGNPMETLIILMTGYSGIADALHAVELGAYDFVSKPFQLPEINVRLYNAARYQTLLRDLHTLKQQPKAPPSLHTSNTEQAVARAYRSSGNGHWNEHLG